MAGQVLHAAVVGASTLLGKELLDEIGNSAAVAWDLRVLEEGDEAEGQLTAAGDEALVIHALNEEAFTGLDLVFFAGPPETTKAYLKSAVQAGTSVVDLSGIAADQPGFLLRSPWVEGSARPDLTTTGISVPHAAALMLATVAQRLARRYGHVELAATVLEPASQAGSAGVDELHQQTVGLLSFQEVPKTIFGSQIAFNLQGDLGEESQVKLAEARTRIQSDARRLLGTGFDGAVSVNVLQAPVFHGYFLSVYVRLNAPSDEAAIRSAVAGDVVVPATDTAPSNQAATETGDLLVGVQLEPEQRNVFWLQLAADNLRLVARSAVQSALELAAMRPGARVQ